MNPASFLPPSNNPVKPNASAGPEDFFGAPISDKTSQDGNQGEDFSEVISRARDTASGKLRRTIEDDNSNPTSQTSPDAGTVSTMLALMGQGNVPLNNQPDVKVADGQGHEAIGSSTDARQRVPTTGADTFKAKKEGTRPNGSVGATQSDGSSKAEASKPSSDISKSLKSLIPVNGPEASNLEQLAKHAEKSAAASQSTSTKEGAANPADNATLKQESAQKAEVQGALLQVADGKQLTMEEAAVEKAISAAGTGVALKGERMKFAAEKNEIAGRTEQKLPRAPHSEAVSPTTAPAPVAGADAKLAGGKKETLDAGAVAELSVKSAALDVAQSKPAENPQPPVVDRSAAQVERIAQLVTREVLMLRQSGATALAVSLKVDPHTELFLQLTNHNGQMQALLRCERGNADALNHHWSDLQDSLSRQNVQLLPLEKRVGATTTVFTPPPVSGGSSPSSQQSPQKQQKSAPEFGDDMPAPIPTNAKLKTKIISHSLDGWEFWA